MQPEITKDTHTKLSIATLVVVGGALISGGWIASREFGGLEHQVRSQGSQLRDLPTRSELRDLESRITGTLRKQMKRAILKCPRLARRGDAWMECQVVFPTEE